MLAEKRWRGTFWRGGTRLFLSEKMVNRFNQISTFFIKENVLIFLEEWKTAEK
jgi:hypothetical protein